MSRWDRYVLRPRVWTATSRSETVSHIGPYNLVLEPYRPQGPFFGRSQVQNKSILQLIRQLSESRILLLLTFVLVRTSAVNVLTLALSPSKLQDLECVEYRNRYNALLASYCLDSDLRFGKSCSTFSLFDSGLTSWSSIDFSPFAQYPHDLSENASLDRHLPLSFLLLISGWLCLSTLSSLCGKLLDRSSSFDKESSLLLVVSRSSSPTYLPHRIVLDLGTRSSVGGREL